MRMFPVGGKVLIRTVTNYFVGEVEYVEDGFIGLAGASWVADTGQFHTCLAEGRVAQHSKYPGPLGRVAVSVASIVDVAEWAHKLL